MAIISCPECGRQVSERAVSCPDCACPISSAHINVAPPVDSITEELSKLLALARRTRESSDNKNAHRYYEHILMKAPGNWEAMFFCVYYEVMECNVGNIASAANSLANCICSTFISVSELESEEEKDDAISTIIKYATYGASLLASSAADHYNKFSSTNDAYSDCSNRVISVANIYVEIESNLKNIFPDKQKTLTDFQRSYYLDFLDNISGLPGSVYSANIRERLITDIAKADPIFRNKLDTERKKKENHEKIEELESKINSINKLIASLPVTRTANKNNWGGVWIFLGIAFISFGLYFAILSVSFSLNWQLCVGVIAIIIGFIISNKKVPSQNVVDSNIQRVKMLREQRKELEAELEALIKETSEFES